MTQPQPHLLTPEDLASIFEEDIRPTLTASSQEQPRVLLFGGPQGSGKTTLRRVVAEQLDLTDAVMYDGDDWFDFHPHFDALAREHGGLEAMRLCGPDVSELRRMTLDHVRQHRQNLVLVGPYTHQEYTFALVEDFREAGYTPEMAYTAVHPALSQLGVAHRYYQATRPGALGYSIVPSLELQESVFAGVPEIVAEAERRGAVQALHVVARTVGVVFSKRQAADGRWAPEGDLTEIVRSAREQPWGAEERAVFERRRADVATMAGEPWPERLASIDRLAAPMLSSRPPTPGEGLAAGRRRPSVAEAARSRSTSAGQLPGAKRPAPGRATSGHDSGPGKRPGRGR